MKLHRPLSPRQEALHERSLYSAILALRTPEELRSFFRDLCTPAELTGVSVTTIGRVARYLTSGNGGYSMAADRLRDSRQG
jgi:uncharacterized protein YerC